MKNKTYLYLGILGALILAAYYITSDRGEKTSSYKISKKLFQLDSIKTDKIEIKNSGGTIVFSKATGDWRVAEPYDYRTINADIEKMVSALKNLELESLVSSNPAKKETFGFKDSDQAEITVYEGGVQKGKFLLGNQAAANSSYIKNVNSDSIFIADDIERGTFVKQNLDDWRDKSIISIPKEAIGSVIYETESETFTVKRDSTGKFYVGQDTVGAAFDGILNLLNKFDATGFKDTILAPDTKFNDAVKIDWGNKTEIRFLKLDTSPVKYLVQVSDDKQIYELEDGAAKNLLKTKKEILGR